MAVKDAKAARKKIMAVLIILVIAILLFWQLPWFRVGQINITPPRTLDPQVIESALAIDKNRHILEEMGGSYQHWTSLRYHTAEKRLTEAFPLIETAEVKLDFPSRLSVTVTERVEIAYVAIPDGCVMLDKQGVAMMIWDQIPDNIPLIEGVSATSLSLGSPLVVNVPEALNQALSLMSAVIEADKDERPAYQLLPRIKGIRPIGGKRLYLTVDLPRTGELLTVLTENNAQSTENMIWLRFALDQHVLANRGKGVLDMTGERITFRPD